jgi:hypothetical protein|tara:strand:- start:12 stop:737 length:726 start_codon:yes stop_codon:yes gene_type:complete
MLGLGNSSSSSGYTPFDPSSITGLIANFNFQSNITLATAELTKWVDTTGVYVLAPPDTNTRPDWDDETGVAFDGAASNPDRLELLDGESVATAITLDSDDGGWCVAIVYTSTNWDDGKRVIGHTSSNSNYIAHSSGSNTVLTKAGGTSKVYSLDTPSSLTDGNFYCIMFNSDAEGLTTMYVNNVAQADTETNTADFVISQVGAGNDANNLAGKIKNLVIYNQDLDATQRNDLYDYLKSSVS